jgi:two-component system CheB/CheR fusion protein
MHLRTLDVNYLKIDGLFTQGVLDNDVDRALIQAINSIAHSVGKTTVAEYVDRPELIAPLKAAGVDFVQGYYLGRPKPSLQQVLHSVEGGLLGSSQAESEASMPAGAY